MTTAFAPTGRIVEAAARVYRRTWRGSVLSTFLSPVLFLLAMGVGLGKLVDAGGADLGVDYLAFLAPGLLASTAMTTAAGDSSFPVMAGIKWRRNYEATLATPIRVEDLVAGHFGWVAIRLTFVSLVYAGVMTAFGATTVVQGLLAVPPALLLGVAVSTVVTAYTARLKSEQGLASLFRWAITPLFLFSGTFFPISQLPGWMQPVAYATPLFHGVELCRRIALDLPSHVNPWFSIAYLVAMTAVGWVLAVRSMRKRLVK